MIDLTTCEGALTEAALDDLSGTLMRALLRAEGVPEEAAAKKSISWFFVNELPARRMYGGARELSGRRPSTGSTSGSRRACSIWSTARHSSPTRLGGSWKLRTTTPTTPLPGRTSGSGS